jgi:hypothetical protein
MAHVAARAKEPERFVFESTEGKSLVYGTFYGAHFRPAVLRLIANGQLPPEKAARRFHDLRHTAPP